MEVGKIASIKQVQINQGFNQQNKKKRKKEEIILSFSEVLKSVNH